MTLEPSEFSITYMLPMTASPLPHTIAIELSTVQGITTFDPVFKRHTPLPAEVRKTYKADRTLRPSDLDATLPIKFWEIEVSEDAQEKWWAGCVHVRADAIKRPIIEGSDLELTVKIDPSRKMTVELFIPLLNQSFANNVYIPDPPTARSQLQQQLDLCFERLSHIKLELYDSDRGDLGPAFEQLQQWAEKIAEQMTTAMRRGNFDPDASLGPTDSLRKLRMQLTRLEEQLEIGTGAMMLARKMRWEVRYVDRVIGMHGTESEQREFQKLLGQYDRYSEVDDARGLKWVRDQLWILHWTVVKDQLWFWQNRLAYLKEPVRSFINREQATKRWRKPTRPMPRGTFHPCVAREPRLGPTATGRTGGGKRA